MPRLLNWTVNGTLSALLLASMVAGASSASAQDNPPPGGPRPGGRFGGPGGPGGPVFGGPGFGGPSPLMAALDTDKDGELSATEIEAAVASLKTLDKNNDGKLTGEEIRPAGPGRPDPAAMVARWMEFDTDKDGSLSKSEVPERMQGFFDRLDADMDGTATAEELKKAAESMGGRGGGRFGGGGGRGRGGRGPGGPGGPGGPEDRGGPPPDAPENP